MTNNETERLMSDVVALIGKNADCPLPEGPQRSFSRLLENFVHLEFTEEDAVFHWKNILDNSRMLTALVGRRVTPYTAIVDYFTGKNPVLSAPLIVEVNVFRQTEQMAMVDALTGLFNRRYMETMLKKECTRCERYGKLFSVCILDIDNFKSLNDIRGHQFGDVVLRELADLLKATIREEDIACRYGGEEFLIIIPETDSVGALVLANRIRQGLKSSDFFVSNGITFSAGTATWSANAQDLEGLVRAADMALYQAKYTGKDRVCAATHERRKFDRFDRKWYLNILSGTAAVRALGENRMQNVSLGGIQFESRESYPLDGDLRFLISRDGDLSGGIEASGRITWIRKKRGVYHYGVRFEDVPDALESQFSGSGKTAQTV
jgi:diguanylate cyclase (GGDEF)-like protein